MERCKWMENLHDDTHITHLSIPGTHDSAAYSAVNWALTLSIQTQQWDISTQLIHGVRYFDLRAGYYNHRLVMWHSDYRVAADTDLEGIFQTFYDFLDNNPSEIIFAQIKQDHVFKHDEANFIQDTYRIIRKNAQYWNCDDDINGKTVGDLRGKIKLLCRFKPRKDADPGPGVDLSNWPDNRNGEPKPNSKYIMQDSYNATKGHKKRFVREWLEHAVGNPKLICINFVSGAYGRTPADTPSCNPRSSALEGNPAVLEHLREKHKGHTGVLMFDFIDQTIVEAVVSRNF